MDQFRHKRYLIAVSALSLTFACFFTLAAPPVIGGLLLDESAGEWFRAELLSLGYEEGKTVHIEYRYSRGENARFPALARELLAQKPAVIFSPCGPALRAIRELDRNVPVVSGCLDPNNYLGEVKSVRRPGGATTGFVFLAPESAGKRLEILKELSPELSRVAVLHNKVDDWGTYKRELKRAALGIGVEIVELPPIERAEDLGAAFTRADRRNAGALIPFVDATMIGAAREVVQLAIEHRLPTAFDFRGFVEVGGLLSYQGNTQELIRHAARYTDMILKGSSPGELPIVQPTKFELIVNLKTAKALGLTIPPSILLRADRVIE